MRRGSSLLSVGLLALAATVLGGPAGAKDDPAGVRVVLELNQQFYYAGDPFPLRVTVLNESGKPVSNPIKNPIVQGLELRNADDAVIKPTGKTDVSEPTPRPEKIGASGFFGTIVDLTQLYPELKSPGRYGIRWTSDGLTSDAIAVTIIPKYDPTRDYQARVETDQGTFVIEFFRESAPIATKAFIDLAATGFYDGLLLSEVRADWYVVGGDPGPAAAGAASFRYPAELNPVPVVAGTVLMKPVGSAPPANGSQFIVMLRPEPTWRGQFTVVGQVVDGLDLVQKISRLPSNQQSERPFFKPLKDVRIVRVTVAEKRPPAAAPPPVENEANGQRNS